VASRHPAVPGARPRNLRLPRPPWSRGCADVGPAPKPRVAAIRLGGTAKVALRRTHAPPRDAVSMDARDRREPWERHRLRAGRQSPRRSCLRLGTS
jgi:hypothetical protein